MFVFGIAFQTPLIILILVKTGLVSIRTLNKYRRHVIVAMLIFAAVFDILDGRLARLSGTTSRFGFEYDSIADTVSFGVAPAVLAFNAGQFHELGWTGWVMGFMFTAGAALRLARFNVTPQRYPGRFEGLPSPAAAGMVL